ncbi:MAG: transglycosylase family protein, partial [Gaiellaceae bacterium]
MRKATLLTALIAMGAFWGVSDAGAHTSKHAPIIHQIDHLRGKTNEIRGLMGRKPATTTFAYRKNKNAAFRKNALKRWRSQLRHTQTMKPLATSVWGRLAACESNGRWAYNGSVIFDGGLQFHPQTWSSYRLRGYPPYAWQATPAQQIRVAKLVQRAQGWRAWP